MVYYMYKLFIPLDPCELNALRECFVELTEATFYVMSRKDKQWMCRYVYLHIKS